MFIADVWAAVAPSLAADFPLEFMQTYATDILLKEPRAFESFNIISGTGTPTSCLPSIRTQHGTSTAAGGSSYVTD
jgi:hypothetical protein